MSACNTGTPKAEIDEAYQQAEAAVRVTKVVKDVNDAHVSVPAYYYNSKWVLTNNI